MQSCIKARGSGLMDLKYHFFEIDLDTLIKQIEGLTMPLPSNKKDFAI